MPFQGRLHALISAGYYVRNNADLVCSPCFIASQLKLASDLSLTVGLGALLLGASFGTVIRCFIIRFYY